MRMLFSAIILSIGVLALYPLLASISLVIDMLIGDGNVSHYLLASTDLRLSVSEIRQDWLNSLPIAAAIMAVLWLLALIAKSWASSFASKAFLLLLAPLAALITGTYLGANIWNGLIYFCCALPLTWAAYMAVLNARKKPSYA